ncbi:EcsC family protein [Neobacillus sp. MM2021_6]|uniref:EcsC family protein n=1 Tax=Bacillaceae TaxID=186817 RepID=UPI00140E37D6|nr:MULTISPECIES: EcsC family protein [Bacillaceae]MBO0960083.1 EcsC family protein [Neobacillus sp. MM2021_6]NHC17493.1 EcsC family protein [Bacillus sp. MM2020_4]
MPLTEREASVLNEIRLWEEKLLNYEANEFQLTYEKYLERSFLLLPEKVQQQFFSLIDTWLFHLHGMIQGSQLQMDAKERILTSGRIFSKDIEEIADIRNLTIDQLQYIAEQQIARHRLYSFAQGGLAGTGGTLLLGADIPAMAVINLRIVQLIAMTYGFEVNTPYEMMTSLKVFHTATLPPRIQIEGWNSLMADLAGNDESYFYQGNEQITDITWLEQPVQQLLKAMVIALFRKKVIQGIPLISMAIGAGANYQLTRKVTDVAHRYYQLRYLKEKEEF